MANDTVNLDGDLRLNPAHQKVFLCPAPLQRQIILLLAGFGIWAQHLGWVAGATKQWHLIHTKTDEPAGCGFPQPHQRLL